MVESLEALLIDIGGDLDLLFKRRLGEPLSLTACGVQPLGELATVESEVSLNRARIESDSYSPPRLVEPERCQ